MSHNKIDKMNKSITWDYTKLSKNVYANKCECILCLLHK